MSPANVRNNSETPSEALRVLCERGPCSIELKLYSAYNDVYYIHSFDTYMFANISKLQ